MIKFFNFYIRLSFCCILVRTLFIKTNSSCLITKSIKVLETKTYMLFNLDFANNTILPSLFFLFKIIDLYFLVPAVIEKCLILSQNS